MAGYSSLLVPILEEILISELGEANIAPLNWSKISNDSYRFFIDIGGTSQYVNVDFRQIVNQNDRDYYLPQKWRTLTVWNVAYNVAGDQNQFGKTDLKTLLTVLSTVVDIIKDFVYRNKPEALFIQPAETILGSGDINRKRNIYQAFILKQVRNIGNYGIDTHRDGFIVVRLK